MGESLGDSRFGEGAPTGKCLVAQMVRKW